MQRNFALFSARTTLHRCRFTEDKRQLNRQLRRTKANLVWYVSLKADRELMSVHRPIGLLLRIIALSDLLIIIIIIIIISLYFRQGAHRNEQ